MLTFSDPRTEALIQVLREHPEGVTLVEIAAHLRPIPPRRTLQRWLQKLVSGKLVTRHGRTNELRYFAGHGRVALPVKKRKPKELPAVVSAPAPKSESAPKTEEKPSHLPPQYRPLFDRLAPKIIRMGYVDDVAIDELAGGFVAEFRNQDVEAMNAFIAAAMAEFDPLDFATAAKKYAIRRTDWTNWRTAWCEARDLPADKA